MITNNTSGIVLLLLKGEFFMPKTKFQDFIFTLIMVAVMVYAMICYNIAMSKGCMSNQVFTLAFGEFPIMYAIGVVVEFFFVGKIVQKIAFKIVNPENTNPFVITLLISSLTVVIMCPIMSLIASLLFGFSGYENILPSFIQTVVRNFPMAFFWQLCYAGPLVRFIFRLLFKKQLKRESKTERQSINEKSAVTD